MCVCVCVLQIVFYIYRRFTINSTWNGSNWLRPGFYVQCERHPKQITTRYIGSKIVCMCTLISFKASVWTLISHTLFLSRSLSRKTTKSIWNHSYQLIATVDYLPEPCMQCKQDTKICIFRLNFACIQIN